MATRKLCMRPNLRHSLCFTSWERLLGNNSLLVSTVPRIVRIGRLLEAIGLKVWHTKFCLMVGISLSSCWVSACFGLFAYCLSICLSLTLTLLSCSSMFDLASFQQGFGARPTRVVAFLCWHHTVFATVVDDIIVYHVCCIKHRNFCAKLPWQSHAGSSTSYTLRLPAASEFLVFTSLTELAHVFQLDSMAKYAQPKYSNHPTFDALNCGTLCF